MKSPKIKSVFYSLTTSIILFFTSLINPALAHAQLGTGDCGPEEIDSAIGCIPVGGTGGFVGFLLPWGIGIAGGVAFILIIYAGFTVMSSAGNPQRLQAGKELLTAAIGGLLLIIFGVFILEFIGVDLLNIPDFGR